MWMERWRGLVTYNAKSKDDGRSWRDGAQLVINEHAAEDGHHCKGAVINGHDLRAKERDKEHAKRRCVRNEAFWCMCMRNEAWSCVCCASTHLRVAEDHHRLL